MDIFEVIKNRRSIRKYTNQPVQQETILQVLEAARLAPSWKNLQCWRYIVIDMPTLKEQILSAFPEDNPGRKAIVQAPVVIVVCANTQESGIENGIEYYVADVAVSFQQLCLAATALGLGTCWIGWFDEARIREVLQIPPSIRVVGITPLGYPDQDPKPRGRKAMKEIAMLNSWNQEMPTGGDA
ncbi:nitroreductase family protein [Chrysiogenes arsenatis]|uniref:nitroreductase family protein n=1 Tax=Chrysiogenes arsenatis TaxID=309797 RepID=UPI0003FD6F59|nr:nitroreductase family protein [Chrysiogenes arsenatis]